MSVLFKYIGIFKYLFYITSVYIHNFVVYIT